MEILEALCRKNDSAQQAKVKQLNEHFDGPIVFSGKGKQPRVERGVLLGWWNGLEGKFDARAQRSRDRQATAEASFEYSGLRDRSEEVVPDIGGHVKRPRKDRGKGRS